jgi:DNA-binding NtrC family response regulator
LSLPFRKTPPAQWGQVGHESATRPDPQASAVPALVSSTTEPQLSYLLVFEQDSSSMFVLPPGGEVVVGRSENCSLQLKDPSVSRTHARIRLGDGAARIADLGSQNGTRINGQRLIGERQLLSGDVVTICSTSLVFHARARPSSRRAGLPFPLFRQRVEEEIARSLRYERVLTILTVSLGGAADRPRIEGAAAEQLRLTDVLGWDGGGEMLLILLPETDSDDARVVAQRILELPTLGGAARAGLATCPTDACDPETLLATSRAAASTAGARGLETAPRVAQSFELGDRTAIVADPAMVALYGLVRRLAAADLPVLIQGETGTGKELVASALHSWSGRASGPLVSVSCAAIPESLVESELLGHDRGAFSGATSAKVGLLEAASGGTVFLDEVGELPLSIQAKFLRLLETHRIARLGDVKERPIDVRVVAATNRDLSEEVKAGRFRQDLFYRLSGGVLWIPPLRDRRQDIPVLARAFVAEACQRAGRPPMIISDDAMRLLSTHDWPGNVRELRNVLDYAVAAHSDPVLEARHVRDRLRATPAAPQLTAVPETPEEQEPDPSSPFRPLHEELQELEKSRISAALESAGGNRTKAAQMIQMPLRTFLAKLKRYGLGRA